MAKKTLIDRINSRGWGNGWHAEMLALKAKHRGITMVDQFRIDIRDASAYNIPAVAISSKGSKVTYRFLDGSTITL